MVAGATAASASMLAGTATRLTPPPTATRSGEQATCAAAATASGSASHLGIRPARASRQPGARITRPAVAETDRVKPTERARSGLTRTSTSTLAASAGRARRGRPLPAATIPINPMTPARRTLGDGRARTTKPNRAAATQPACSHGPNRLRRMTTVAAAMMIAQFAPETATRCDIPAVRKSSRTSPSRLLVSPRTRPGSSPRRGPSSPDAASRNPARR